MASARVCHLIASATLAQLVGGFFFHHRHGAWPLKGECVAVWTSPSKLVLPYTVQFEATQFHWQASSADGGMLEGEGAVIGPVIHRGKTDGSSTIQFFSASRTRPDLNRSTHCSCAYARLSGESSVAILTYYAVAIAPNSTQMPMLTTCEPHRRFCPQDNDTAFAEIGAPFVEEYAGCASQAVWRQFHIEMLIFVCLLAAGGVLIIAMLVSNRSGGPSLCTVGSVRPCFAEDIPQQICGREVSEWHFYRQNSNTTSTLSQFSSIGNVMNTPSTLSQASSIGNMMNLDDVLTPELGTSRGASSGHLSSQSYWVTAHMNLDWLRKPLLSC